MKNLLAGEKNRTKKNATKKMTTPMPMGRKQKKWMGLYMTLVLIATVGATTVFAAGDPLSVINNLSTFIFSLIRAIGLGKWISDTGRRRDYYVRQRNPGSDHGVSL